MSTLHLHADCDLNGMSSKRWALYGGIAGLGAAYYSFRKEEKVLCALPLKIPFKSAVQSTLSCKIMYLLDRAQEPRLQTPHKQT